MENNLVLRIGSPELWAGKLQSHPCSAYIGSILSQRCWTLLQGSCLEVFLPWDQNTALSRKRSWNLLGRQYSPTHQEALDVAWPKVSKSVPRLWSKMVKYFISRRNLTKQVCVELYWVLELGKKPYVVYADPAAVEAWHAKVREYHRGKEKILYSLWNFLHAKSVF